MSKYFFFLSFLTGCDFLSKQKKKMTMIMKRQKRRKSNATALSMIVLLHHSLERKCLPILVILFSEAQEKAGQMSSAPLVSIPLQKRTYDVVPRTHKTPLMEWDLRPQPMVLTGQFQLKILFFKKRQELGIRTLYLDRPSCGMK